jgi:hypothetical protein
LGFRRSPDRLAAQRRWQRFVERNADTVARAGLPPQATASVAAWDDLLMHGQIAEDPSGFSLDRLSGDQYESLVQLVSSYFATGYEFYLPMALRPDDRATLRARFGGGR